MGGNALSRPSTRLQKVDYERVAADVVARLKATYPDNRVYAIESYRSKPSFGDLDVLVESTGYDPHVAAAALGVVEVVRNGTVTSMGLRLRPDLEAPDDQLFQVDLISSPPVEFDFSSYYFRYSDMGNLLGRVSHAMSLALRHDGLVLYMRDGTHQFANIMVSRDFSQALDFLGYDSKRYFEGFEDLEEIFQYVSSTPYFNPDIFLLANRNAHARVRDRKRPTYTAFLKWCEERPELRKFVMPEDKAEWLPRVFEFFPHVRAEHQAALDALAERRAVSAKFNGAWVSELTGLKGLELSIVLRRFRDTFETPEAMHVYLLNAAPADIANRVLEVKALHVE